MKMNQLKRADTEVSPNPEELESVRDTDGTTEYVNNTGKKTIKDWTLEIGYKENVNVTTIWNAVLSSDNGIKISNESYNGEISSGESVYFGYITESQKQEILPVSCKITKNSGEMVEENGDAIPTPTEIPEKEREELKDLLENSTQFAARTQAYAMMWVRE